MKKSGRGRLRAQDIPGILTVERIRPIQIVEGSFIASAALVVGLTVAASPTSSEVKGLGLVQILGMVGMILWVAGYILGHRLFKKRTALSAIEEAMVQPWKGPAQLAGEITPADKIVFQLRRAWVGRTAAMGSGPVFCLVSLQAAKMGNIPADPSILSVGTIPMVFFVVLTLMTWPTRARLVETLQKALEDKS